MKISRRRNTCTPTRENLSLGEVLTFSETLWRRSRRGIFFGFALFLVCDSALAQVFIIPRRPGQSNVRYFDYEWKTIVIRPFEDAPPEASSLAAEAVKAADAAALAAKNSAQASAENDEDADDEETDSDEETEDENEGDDDPDDEVDKDDEEEKKPRDEVLLYFYERERKIAERAAASITTTYLRLAKEFEFRPRKTLPYILYSSYQEFLQTNLFPLREGVLGVTSTIDLTLALPYFGDPALFQDVSAHEMAHQFTIHKVRALARDAKAPSDPLRELPLWFVEGIAEYYAKGGIDPEADMLVRDRIVNPGPRMLPTDYFASPPRDFVGIYKLGQLRVGFLEEVYGEGTVQRILGEAAQMYKLRAGRRTRFSALVAYVTEASVDQIRSRFEEWLKRRSYAAYLDAQQNESFPKMLDGIRGPVSAMAASHTGELLMYRTFNLYTGQVELRLVDPRLPKKSVSVVSDQVPGIESLHPVSARNFAVSPKQVAYIAESNGRDVLYVQDINHTFEACEPVKKKRRRRRRRRECPQATIELGERRTYDFTNHNILALSAVAFEPEGNRIAIIGLHTEGTQDVYLVTPEGDDYQFQAITEDVYAERDLVWGGSGLVFTSNATAHGKYNLFRYDTAKNQVNRITYGARDQRSPLTTEDKVYFTAFDAKGRANLYEAGRDVIWKRTDFGSGIITLGNAPEGDLWALVQNSGQLRPARLPQGEFLDVEIEAPAELGGPRPFARQSLVGAQPYSAIDPANWELGNIFGIAGFGDGGIFGQLFGSGTDKLRNHGVFFTLFAFGSFRLIDGFLLYVNQSQRLTWATGPFQQLTYRIDRSFEQDVGTFLSVERFFGWQGTLRYPLNRFVFVQGRLAAGGNEVFVTDGVEDDLRTLELFKPWDDRNGGVASRAEASFALGYDTTRFHPTTGPISGTAVLFEATGGVRDLGQVERNSYSQLRLDMEQYLQVFGRVNILARVGAGQAFGRKRIAQQFYLSSFDTLRGIEFGDDERLLGRSFFYSTLELQIPLDALVRLVFLQSVEGIAGLDFGGVGNTFERVWERRVFDAVLGLNFLLGPFLFRLHFAKPIDVGAPAPTPGFDWVTNFSLRWAYF